MEKRKAGKIIGGCIYVHKSYAEEFPCFFKARELLPPEFEFHVVKCDLYRDSLSFIQCFDFDINPEPTVGDSIKINTFIGKFTFTKKAKDPWIYHHKWMFVEDDYSGFNVKESKLRSKQWDLLVTSEERCRIGKRSFWENKIIPRIPLTYFE